MVQKQVVILVEHEHSRKYKGHIIGLVIDMISLHGLSVVRNVQDENFLHRKFKFCCSKPWWELPLRELLWTYLDPCLDPKRESLYSNSNGLFYRVGRGLPFKE